MQVRRRLTLCGSTICPPDSGSSKARPARWQSCTDQREGATLSALSRGGRAYPHRWSYVDASREDGSRAKSWPVTEPEGTLTVGSRSEHIEPVLRSHDAQRAVDIAGKATCDHQRESRCLIALLDQHVHMTEYALRARTNG